VIPDVPKSLSQEAGNSVQFLIDARVFLGIGMVGTRDDRRHDPGVHGEGEGDSVRTGLELGTHESGKVGEAPQGSAFADQNMLHVLYKTEYVGHGIPPSWLTDTLEV